MNPSEFIHPEDEAALRQMKSIPGVTTLMKKILSIGAETQEYGINMASNIRLSETQMPELYKHLPPICQKLGIAEPEFYLKLDPYPNAWTYGDTRIYITMTSGLINLMSDEEIDAILAHECGHVLCHHVLYHSALNTALRFSDVILEVTPLLTTPVQYALWYWRRKSELSADRVASIVTSPEAVMSFLARYAGGLSSRRLNVNFEEWAKQADIYDQIYNDGKWNKTLQVLATADLTHPFNAVRVREIMKWSESEQYKNLKASMDAQPSDAICPNCHHTVETNWRFCQHCGTPLK